MAIDLIAIAKGAVTILSPFLPYLVSLGKSAEKKIQDTIAEKGGDIVWSQAQKLWGKIRGTFKEDVEITSVANIVAVAPEDAKRQQMLTEVLADRLQRDTGLAQELLTIMGGPAGVQRVIGGNEAQISNIDQRMAGSGEQAVQAGDKAVIQGVTQTQDMRGK